MSEQESIPDYLARVRIKDAAKGGDGSRTTREVADFYGVSLSAARRRLYRHFDAQEIEAFDSGNDNQGAPIIWRAKATNQ